MEMKAYREAAGGRILLGSITEGGAVILRPIRFQCAGVCIADGVLCINVYNSIRMYSIPTYMNSTSGPSRT
jgi:hypothetical protein